MNIVRAVSIFLCGVPLLALSVSSASRISYVQEDVRTLASEHALKYPLLSEISIHEAGYARLAIGLIGLVLLTFPFRKGDLSSWIALAIIFLYQVPVFLLPRWTQMPGWQDLRMLFSPGMPRVLVLNLVFPVLFLLGLVVSLPGFLRVRQMPRD
jgi:hypothetical protein